MPFISARFAPPPAFEGDQQMIIATDENGVEWWLTEDSEVGDWLRYKEEGGTVREADAPTPTEGCD